MELQRDTTIQYVRGIRLINLSIQWIQLHINTISIRYEFIDIHMLSHSKMQYNIYDPQISHGINVGKNTHYSYPR